MVLTALFLTAQAFLTGTPYDSASCHVTQATISEDGARLVLLSPQTQFAHQHRLHRSYRLPANVAEGFPALGISLDCLATNRDISACTEGLAADVADRVRPLPLPQDGDWAPFAIRAPFDQYDPYAWHAISERYSFIALEHLERGRRFLLIDRASGTARDILEPCIVDPQKGPFSRTPMRLATPETGRTIDLVQVHARRDGMERDRLAALPALGDESRIALVLFGQSADGTGLDWPAYVYADDHVDVFVATGTGEIPLSRCEQTITALRSEFGDSYRAVGVMGHGDGWQVIVPALDGSGGCNADFAIFVQSAGRPTGSLSGVVEFGNRIPVLLELIADDAWGYGSIRPALNRETHDSSSIYIWLHDEFFTPDINGMRELRGNVRGFGSVKRFLDEISLPDRDG